MDMALVYVSTLLQRFSSMVQRAVAMAVRQFELPIHQSQLRYPESATGLFGLFAPSGYSTNSRSV